MIGSPLAKADEAPGRGTNWGMAAPSPTLPRGTRIKVGTTGSLERILLGPAHVTDGSENLVGALRQSMAALGARDDPRDAGRRDGLRAIRPRPKASPGSEPADRHGARPRRARTGRPPHRSWARQWRGALGGREIHRRAGRLRCWCPPTGTGQGWVQNLLADASVTVLIGERQFDAVAEPLVGSDHHRVVRELILRYGTPSERLGRGPSFRLRPVESSTCPSRSSTRSPSRRPPAEVFAFVADLDGWPRWLIASGIVAVHREDPRVGTMPAAGERMTIEQRAAGRAGTFEVTVTAVEPGTRLALDGKDGDGVRIAIEAVVARGRGALRARAGQSAPPAASDLRLVVPDRSAIPLPHLRGDGRAAGPPRGHARSRGAAPSSGVRRVRLTVSMTRCRRMAMWLEPQSIAHRASACTASPVSPA